MSPVIIDTPHGPVIINALRTGQVSIQFDGRSVLMDRKQALELRRALFDAVYKTEG